jgi:hypothetical protein
MAFPGPKTKNAANSKSRRKLKTQLYTIRTVHDKSKNVNENIEKSAGPDWRLRGGWAAARLLA